MWVIWFLSLPLFCFFDCFVFVGQHRETRPRSEAREGFRTISVCLGNRAGLIVDAMLDPVSQQPYRVFFSFLWSRRQAGQPARLTSIDPSSARLWHHSRGDGEKQVEGDIIRPQRPVSRDSYLHLVSQCRHEKSRPDAVKDCPRRGHLFSVNIQPYLASPFPAVWFETSIHHAPQRSSPTGGPSEQQGTPPGWRTARQKPLPPRKHGMGHFMTTVLARAQCAMDDGRLRRQPVFFDTPNGVARKRETAPWSPRHHHPALGDIRDGALRNHTSHLCVAQNLLDNLSTGQASNLSITTSITELAERGMERIRQALRRRPGGTKARRHSALAHHVSGRKRSLLPGTDYRLLPTDGECHQRHVSPDGDMTNLP